MAVALVEVQVPQFKTPVHLLFVHLHISAHTCYSVRYIYIYRFVASSQISYAFEGVADLLRSGDPSASTTLQRTVSMFNPGLINYHPTSRNATVPPENSTWNDLEVVQLGTASRGCTGTGGTGTLCDPPETWRPGAQRLAETGCGRGDQEPPAPPGWMVWPFWRTEGVYAGSQSMGDPVSHFGDPDRFDFVDLSENFTRQI